MRGGCKAKASTFTTGQTERARLECYRHQRRPWGPKPSRRKKDALALLSETQKALVLPFGLPNAGLSNDHKLSRGPKPSGREGVKVNPGG